MKFINVILVALALFFAYRKNWIVGVLVTLLVIALGIVYFVPQILRARARMAFAKGEFDEAEKWFRLSIKTKRANPDIRMEYAYVLLRTGKVDEAEQNRFLEAVQDLSNLPAGSLDDLNITASVELKTGKKGIF